MAAIQNYRFAVVRKPEPPWTLVECMREDRSTSFLNFVRRCNGKYGAAVDATILMAEYLQWNISFIWSSTWGSLLNGTWVGAVGDVMRHEAESCIPQVSPNYARSTAVDFAGYMFMEQKTCFAFCHSAQHVVTFKLSRLFQDPWLVGGLFLLTIFAFGFVFHMIRWSQGKKNSLQRTCATLVKAACGIHTKYSQYSMDMSFVEKLYQGFFGLFMMAVFKGVLQPQLMSSFVVHPPIPPFKSICDLATKMRHGALSLLVDHPTDAFFIDLKNANDCLRRAVRKNPASLVYRKDGYGISSQIHNPSIISYHYRTFNRWELHKYVGKNPLAFGTCMFDHLCDKTGWPDGFLVAKGQPQLYEDLIRATRHLREFGFVKKIESFYSMDEEVSIKTKSTAKPSYIKSTMWVFGFGVICCVLAFLTEFAYGTFAGRFRSWNLNEDCKDF